MRARIFVHMLFIFSCCWLTAVPVSADETDETLTLLGQPAVDDSVAGRFPRPLSRTAENSTVITADDIARLNAHTLVDILATVPGVQLESQIGSANAVYTRIQGSNFSHVQVLLDGIPYNNLGDNFADIGKIPAHIIERVEIVKGAASSAWGQALGGVINVITKAAEAEQEPEGTVTLAHGERGSSAAEAELRGSSDRLGYYLAGGYLASNGFTTNTGFNSATGHGRLSYELANHGQLGLLLNYSRHDRGDLAFAPFDYQSGDDSHRLISALALHLPLSHQLTVDLNGYHSDNSFSISTATLTTNTPLQHLDIMEKVTGLGARLLWQQSGNLLVAGLDYQHAAMHTNDTLVNVDLLDRRADRWGLYLNDTLTLGPLALATGARYDLTDTSGDQFSPSFGLTWQVSDTTLLRGYTALGYSLPAFTLDRGSEKVWTSQLGVESSALPRLWLKATLFRNDTSDITVRNPTTGAFESERQIRQGMELEGRTGSWHDFSLRSGYNYVDARRSSDDSVVLDVPVHTLHVALQYDNRRSFSGVLTGRHLFWNSEAYRNGSYQGMLWDLHLNARPFSGDYKGVELFFSARNLFNGSQYLDEAYRNNSQWFEGGVRFRF